MLDAVKAALEKDGEQASGSDEGEDADESESGEDEDEDGKSEAEKAEAEKAKADADKAKDEAEDKTPPPFAEHPAWKRQLQKRKEAEDRATEAESMVAQYKQSHDTVEHLNSYMRESGLSTDDVNNSLAIARLINTDPAKALEALTPVVVHLQERVGIKLPTDLDDEVKQGLITQERAQELAKRRIDETTSKEQSERQTELTRQDAVRGVITAISDWETEWSKSDPDYKVLQDRVSEKLKLALYENKLPLDKSEVIKMADDIRENERKALKARSSKREIKPNTPTGSAPRGMTPAPKSMLDVVKLAGRGG
ncbi:MAG TPA: hypothetical protein VKA19_05335 [Alphaproteobacteria bacterium]|nr:hypothetical protein [Alphaproteobacteria bacterium]